MSAESWISNVAQDLPEEEARLIAALQTPLGLATFSDKVSKTTPPATPVWYIVSHQDRAVSVELQEALAKRLNARTTVLETSHMSLLSAPDAVAAVIKEAVEAVAP